MLSVSLSVCVDKLIDFAFKIEELYARQHIRVRAWHRVNIILSHFCRSWTNKTVQGCGYSTKCRSLNDTKDQRSQASFQKQERLHETIPCVRKKYHLHQATGNRHYLQGNTNVFFLWKYSRPGGNIPSRSRISLEKWNNDFAEWETRKDDTRRTIKKKKNSFSVRKTLGDAYGNQIFRN